MKKLPTALKTPARVVIVVGLIVLVVEFLVMLLIEGIHNTILKDVVPEKIALELIDPILLVAIVSPAFYLLIFRPMRRQQVELENQLDELRRFNEVTVGRELRMKELTEEIAALRNPLSTEPAGDIPVTSSSLEVPHHAAEQPPATQPTEESRHSALLFMLEDLETARKKIEQAHQEWIAALDVVDDPIFLHDKQFRVLRCNKAYQQRAGMPFKQIIGQPYYEVFPKNYGPLPSCLRALGKKEEEQEEVTSSVAIYRSRAFSIHDEQGAPLYSVHTLEDITESRRIELALHESEEKFRVIFEGALDGILLANAETKLFSISNPTMCRMLGYNPDEIIRLGISDIHPQQDLHHVIEQFERQLRSEIQLAADIPVKRKDGSVFYADIKSAPVNFGGKTYLVCMFRDITERKQAERGLKDLSDRLQHILASTPAVHYACRVEGELFVPTYASPNLKGIWDYDLKECLGNAEWWWAGIHPEGRDSIVEIFRAAVMATDRSHYAHEYRFRRKDGTYCWVHDELQIIRDQAGQPLEIVGSWLDITERRQAEQALRESEKLYRSLFENMLNGFAYCRMIFEHDQPQDFIYLSVNAAFEALTGLNNVVGRKVSEVIPGIRQSDAGLFEIYGRVSLSGKPERFEIYVEALRQWFWISAYSPAKSYFVAVFDVITERKLAEIAVQHANRALATLSAVNRTLVRAASENELLQAICEAIVQQRGYRLAWVGYVQHDEKKSIKIMAHAGHEEGYLDAMQLTWADTEHGMGSSGRAIRSGATQLCQDIANDPYCQLWRDAALKRGYAASIALPLGNGEVFGVLNVYAAEANAFTPAEIDLLEEMAGDLAFGVHTLHTRHERDLAMEQNRRHLAQLKDSLEDTVRAMASLVEMRDPYTAGHQARVADLAAAIARQMGLPDEQVHAIHLAGVVHDLGKIQIPAEILSKPGRISDIEFSLIKVHPQAGYDILKGIDFPWPIAQMVLQHHERLDGSGYPQGLKGDAILLGARILSVADVAEAMSSHRPYRPGLGIEVALAEITKQRGVHYDSQVADACLAVFREQSYQLPS